MQSNLQFNTDVEIQFPFLHMELSITILHNAAENAAFVSNHPQSSKSGLKSEVVLAEFVHIIILIM